MSLNDSRTFLIFSPPYSIQFFQEDQLVFGQVFSEIYDLTNKKVNHNHGIHRLILNVCPLSACNYLLNISSQNTKVGLKIVLEVRLFPISIII